MTSSAPRPATLIGLVLLATTVFVGAGGVALHAQAAQRHRKLFPPENLGMLEAPDRAAWVLPARPHALLAGLNDPLVGDLAEVSSGSYHRLDGAPAADTVRRSGPTSARLNSVRATAEPTGDF